MSPQLSPAQVQHALDNGAKLVASKKMEIAAYAELAIYAPDALGFLLNDDGTKQQGDPDTPPQILRQATRNLFQAKVQRAEVELEELEMQVRMLQHQFKQSQSRIQLPTFKG